MIIAMDSGLFYSKKILPLKNTLDYSEKKWIVAKCNEIATKWVFNYEQKNTTKMCCISGSKGSGKTHILNIFKKKSNAFEFLNEHSKTSPSELIYKYKNHNSFVCDDIENFDEKWLFDIFNLLKMRNSYTLFTTNKNIYDWNFKIKDLESRIKSMNIINISQPDDSLIPYIIDKQFKDNGITIDEQTIDYLTKIIPRGFEDIIFWTNKLNEYSLFFGKKISRNLINHVLVDSSKNDDL